MRVKDVMTNKVEGIQVNDNVTHAAARMREFDVGAIPVFDENRIVGMLTDRDIAIRVVAQSFNPAQTSVGEIMTKDAKFINENSDLQEAAGVMENYKIRRLLVRNDQGDVCGIVSIGDIALHGQKEILSEVLSSVSGHPRERQ